MERIPNDFHIKKAAVQAAVIQIINHPLMVPFNVRKRSSHTRLKGSCPLTGVPVYGKWISGINPAKAHHRAAFVTTRMAVPGTKPVAGYSFDDYCKLITILLFFK